MKIILFLLVSYFIIFLTLSDKSLCAMNIIFKYILFNFAAIHNKLIILNFRANTWKNHPIDNSTLLMKTIKVQISRN
jgi:hypothetical protein